MVSLSLSFSGTCIVLDDWWRFLSFSISGGDSLRAEDVVQGAYLVCCIRVGVMRRIRAFPPGVCGAESSRSTSAVLRCGALYIHRHHSADRSYSQEIQDRQNAFRWSAHHVFRPHQHFTYDPTSWSRVLGEKVKRPRTLSLLERVKMTAEHVAERAGNAAALDEVIQGRKLEAQPLEESASAMGVPGFLFAATGTLTSSHAAADSASSSAVSNEWSAVSLQELVGEVQRLQCLLQSPRYAGNASLRQRARLDADFCATLLQLYERLRDAQLDTTVTPDACAFGWFLLTHNLEPLLRTVASARQQKLTSDLSEGSDEAAAVRDVFVSLRAVVLQPMVEGRRFFTAATSGELSLEALIELLSIATAPFVRRCAERFSEDGVLASKTFLHYVACISAAARQRAHSVTADPDAVEDSAVQEWLDPPHLAAWATSLRRLQAHEVPILSTLSDLELQVEHAAEYVTQLLKTITDLTPGGRVTASLSRPRPTPQESSSQVQRNVPPKPICLDATAAPHGVQIPPTESGDAGYILVAATAALHLAHTAAATNMVRKESARRIVYASLRMLTHTPNYDLCPDEVIAWACEVLDAEHLMRVDDLRRTVPGDGGSGKAGLRFLLLLSRLSYGSVVHRTALGRMALRLCRWPEPAYACGEEILEWRRLRGVVMRGVLCVLQVPDLEAAAAQLGSEETVTWLETLAFGEYNGVIPMALWRDAALSLFPQLRYHLEGSTAAPFPSPRESSSASCCRPREAKALCSLCSRYVAREETGILAPTNLHSIFTARCIAECLAAVLSNPTLPDTLLRSADAWDGLCASLPESVKMVATCMREVVRREVSPSKVLSF
ncbi:hypothetical protein LPMP_160130 [Leishmania panamensis]|uniref:Uncharacterized protein n=1 Tax=Leishmania panamensis TaxID=5679 RepID=A0A088RNQ9_LEIPA|nr:hypothetical protein LPMP_160130 [Leishmania panamensis]AIN96889.1 hypothetical protein LPMP_160130 [Leishmania panamensis]